MFRKIVPARSLTVFKCSHPSLCAVSQIGGYLSIDKSIRIFGQEVERGGGRRSPPIAMFTAQKRIIKLKKILTQRILRNDLIRRMEKKF